MTQLPPFAIPSVQLPPIPPKKDRASEIEARLLRFDAIQPVLSLNYLVKGWLSKGGLAILYGPSNAGKTFIAIDIAMHVAAGQPWRGHKVRGGGVLYIAAEGGSGVKNRLAAIRQERPGFAGANFTLLPVSLDLHAPGDAQAVCEIMPDETPALVVVDTLARSMGAGDENSARDAAMFVANCDLIREATGAALMVVHHTGKDQERGARGSSALRAAVDTELHVTDEWEIVCKKQRDIAIGATQYFSLREVILGNDDDGEPVTSAVVDPAVAPRQKLIKPLKGKDAVAMQALKEALRAHGKLDQAGRKVVHVDHWREACGVHGLTTGVSDSAARTAFMRAKSKLIDLDEVREYGDHVWGVRGDD